MPDLRFDDSPFSGITPRRVKRRQPSSESPFSAPDRPKPRQRDTGHAPIPPPIRSGTSRRFGVVDDAGEAGRGRTGDPPRRRRADGGHPADDNAPWPEFDDSARRRVERYRPRSGGPGDPLRSGASRRTGPASDWSDDGNGRDNGYGDDDGYDGDGARVVRAGGPGGRMLAVAGVLFLVLSVGIAGVGSMMSRPDGNGDGRVAAIPGGEVPATVVPTATTDDRPLVSWDDSPVPTMTLPPAGQLERGYEGQYLDGIRTVCIDPGHGGPDRGRTFDGDGNIPPLVEADFTLDQSFLLHDLLVARGYIVVMTRVEDTAVNASGADVNGDGLTIADDQRAGTYDEIQARIDVCNRGNADLLVSVHINGFDTGRPSGYEAWYTAARPFGEQSAVFAQLGVEALGDGMAEVGYEPENRGAKDDGTFSIDDSDPTLAHNMLLTGPELPGQLTPSGMPGAIMEPGFITNIDDAAFLLSDDGNAIIVRACADAIDGYFARFES